MQSAPSHFAHSMIDTIIHKTTEPNGILLTERKKSKQVQLVLKKQLQCAILMNTNRRGRRLLARIGENRILYASPTTHFPTRRKTDVSEILFFLVGVLGNIVLLDGNPMVGDSRQIRNAYAESTEKPRWGEFAVGYRACPPKNTGR